MSHLFCGTFRVALDTDIIDVAAEDLLEWLGPLMFSWHDGAYLLTRNARPHTYGSLYMHFRIHVVWRTVIAIFEGTSPRAWRQTAKRHN